MATKFQVIEDNGGGLYLFVFTGPKRDNLVACIENLEYAPAGEGNEVYYALQTDAVKAIETWEGRREDYEEVYDRFCDDDTSRVIADEESVYPGRMGAAGERYFGIEDDADEDTVPVKLMLTGDEIVTGATDIIKNLRSVPILGDQTRYLYLLDRLQDFIDSVSVAVSVGG